MFDPLEIDIQTPKGVSDFLPEQASIIGKIESEIGALFESWGFQRIIPPYLEYQDVISAGLDDELKKQMFRFDDRQGNRLLAIPPDITPQIARIVASRMSSAPLPHRLWYLGRVLRQAEKGSGKSRELRQAGIELIGLDSPEADAEMIAISIEALLRLGFSRFKIDISHAGFTRGILDDLNVPSATRRRMETSLYRKDLSALEQILAESDISSEAKEAVLSLPRLFGGREIIAKARAVASSGKSKAALDNLEQVLQIVDMHGVGEYVVIDLGEMRGFGYHTGLAFEGFIEGIGEPVCSGGRYDDLMSGFGCPSPATGFAFNILTLLAATESAPYQNAFKRDYLIFNSTDNRMKALELSRRIRESGFSAARDIIRRNLEDSLGYARRMNIRYLLVIDNDSADGSYTRHEALTGKMIRITEEELFKPKEKK